MAKTSVDIPQLKFNKMSTAKYEELKLAGQLNDNEFYITPDGGTIPEVNETTNDFVLSNNGTDLNWVQETEYTKNRIDSKLDDNIRTNCLTKIPQDIKLELSEGVLILKSGSKIYVPNGLQEDGINKKFNEIIVGEDIQLVTSAPDSHRMFFLQIDINNSITGQWNFGDGQKVDSGDEPEISLYGVWYDISNNIIKISTDGSSWNTDVKLSLPICIAVSDSSNNFVSFDQVFNGFGYLGNTWYVLPGVNVLIPNGFDSNKNYNNVNLTIPDVRIYTSTIDKSGYLVIQETNVVSDIIKDIQTREEAKEDGYYYIISENKHYYYFNNMWNPILRANVGKITYNETGGVISFNPQNVFQAVSKNDTNWVSSQCKPSNRYIDIPLEASATTYISPDNGYVSLRKIAPSVGQFVQVFAVDDNGKYLTGSSTVSPTAPNTLFACTPVRKGGKFSVSYSASGETVDFIFVYDEGAK